jgi:hypothetical protein
MIALIPEATGNQTPPNVEVWIRMKTFSAA